MIPFGPLDSPDNSHIIDSDSKTDTIQPRYSAKSHDIGEGHIYCDVSFFWVKGQINWERVMNKLFLLQKFATPP